MVGMRLLKRWPALYELAAGVYFAVQPSRIRERLHGTRVHEEWWETRHIHGGNDWDPKDTSRSADDWVLGYWASRDHPHRTFLLERIAAHAPFTSVLEIGANCGPNLDLLARRFPDARLTGLDINPEAVAVGQRLMEAEGLTNVKLQVGRADDLSQFPDNSFDIIFTDAVLIYVGRDKIRQVVREIMRVARRAVLFLEQQGTRPRSKDPQGMGYHHHSLWLRDYAALLHSYLPEGNIRLTRFTPDVWPDESWIRHGAVIEGILPPVS